MNASAENRCFLLTPRGAGAIAVIRLTGPDANRILGRFFKPHARHEPGAAAANRISYGRILGSDTLVVDDVLVSPTPSLASAEYRDHRSYDITAHGGIRVVERILDIITQAGAIHCSPSKPDRDIWNSKNEIEREAVEALCSARTRRALCFLASQRQGLPDALEKIAATCTRNVQEAKSALYRLVETQPAAQVLVQGARIAVVGPPNSGKSTLFNYLVGHRAAIVSPRSGTTRDWVTASVEFRGIPIDLVDTAGVGATHDLLEKAAMEAGNAVATVCDLVVHVVDAWHGPQHIERANSPANGKRSPRQITAINKIDLAGEKNQLPDAPGDVCWISAKTGTGIDTLINACLSLLGHDGFQDAAPCLFNERQLAASQIALAYLDKAPEQAAELIGCELIGQNIA